jgi:hypothetical protein
MIDPKTYPCTTRRDQHCVHRTGLAVHISTTEYGYHDTLKCCWCQDCQRCCWCGGLFCRSSATHNLIPEGHGPHFMDKEPR